MRGSIFVSSGVSAKVFCFISVVLSFFSSDSFAASSIETVKCGQILTREFDAAHQIHDYKISAEPGETLKLRVVPLGDTLSVRVAVFEPVGQIVAEKPYQQEVRLTAGKLSGRGIHTIRIRNSQYNGDGGDSRIGIYTLEISCILSDGTKVEAGAQDGGSISTPTLQTTPVSGGAGTGLEGLGKYADDVQKVQAATGAAQQAVEVLSDVVTLARGLKFWGKKKTAQGAADAPPPVYQRPEDVVKRGQQPVYAQPVEEPAAPAPRPAASSGKPSSVVNRRTFPLLGLGTILQGEITASGGTQGCRFQAQAGQGIDLTFERLLGNQGLTVTVFAPDQQAVFQASVLASPRIATTLQLPFAGEYAVEIATAGASSARLAQFRLHLAASK